jgi:hypothetical protein
MKAIPASLLFKIFIYSLDEICPCCKACKGKGKIADKKIGEKECTECGGDGVQEPFPYPPNSTLRILGMSNIK